MRQGSLLNNSRLMLYPHWSCSKIVDPTCSREMWQMKKAPLSGLKENWKMPELTDKSANVFTEIPLDELDFSINSTASACPCQLKPLGVAQLDIGIPNWKTTNLYYVWTAVTLQQIGALYESLAFWAYSPSIIFQLCPFGTSKKLKPYNYLEFNQSQKWKIE